ncbi:hypothetical protein HDU97_010335 [Phlyctochytrium planicorne]|nr:hypothetical protein HDU97_010335 [Phlyctochytrium planicorne]
MPVSASLDDLKTTIETHTQIPPQNQRLLLSGKVIGVNRSSIQPEEAPKIPLSSLSLKPNAKIMLIGSTQATVDAVVQKTKQLAIAQRNYAKHATTAKPHVEPITTYFNTLRVLPGLPDQSKALALLEKLRSDVGVRTIMQKRGWRVGVLMELHPDERTILGYNTNKGAAIALRLRTDDLEGFRVYKEIQRVLIHELTHMVWSDHDRRFHALNRELWKELETYSTGSTLGGSPHFSGSDGVESSSFGGGTQVLGGKPQPTDKPMREILAEAALLRLTKEEEEMMESCGTDKSKP